MYTGIYIPPDIAIGVYIYFHQVGNGLKNSMCILWNEYHAEVKRINGSVHTDVKKKSQNMLRGSYRTVYKVSQNNHTKNILYTYV